MDKPNPRVNNLIMQVVENQLRDDKPPETKQTLARLMGEGFSEEESKHYIGSAIVAEMYYVLKSSKPFNAERYLDLLNKLPELPKND
jgi:predicted nucleic-acid-binding protein